MKEKKTIQNDELMIMEMFMLSLSPQKWFDFYVRTFIQQTSSSFSASNEYFILNGNEFQSMVDERQAIT